MRHAGFTLMEMLLTIAIAVLLALLIVPNLMNSIPRLAAESEGLRLRADLLYTQQLAIFHGRSCRVVFDSIGDQVTIQQRGETGYEVVSERTLSNNVDLVSSTFDGSFIQYNLLGEAEVGGNVTLRSNNGATVTVTVEPATGSVIVMSGGREVTGQ